MPATLLDGAALAASINTDTRARIAASGTTPGLAIVLVGEHPASRVYVRRKLHVAAEVGIHAELHEFPATVTAAELHTAIGVLNARADVHGIIVQQPLPAHLDAVAIASAVAPAKDVDGLHPENLGLLALGQPRIIPATPKGIRVLLLRTGHDPAGARVVIVGRGTFVGRPLASLLLQRGRGGDATVTVCHSKTPNLAAVTRTADILVAAAGHPHLITAPMVRPGAIVVDVGIHRIADTATASDTRITGDVAFAEVAEVAGAITPVPGGVGPMTVAMLLENVAETAR